MSEMPSLPIAGQDPWDTDLNAYLTALEARLSALEAQQTIPSLLYLYSNNTSQAPPSGELRTNAAFASSSFLYINQITRAGADATPALAKLDMSYKLFIQDADDASTRQWYQITALPMSQGNWFSIGVSHISGVPGAPNNNRPVTLTFTNQA